MSKKDTRSLDDLQCIYWSELHMMLTDLCEGKKPPAKYAGWDLSDCYDMLKFYELIDARQYKRAFNKLTDLWKERCLVPQAVATKLWEIVDPKGIDW